MALISFKAKAEPMQYYGEDAPRYYRVKIPQLNRKHCDMNAFRSHPKYGSYANSDLFIGILQSIRKSTFASDYLRLDAIPDGVSVDTSGFLVVVTWDV